MASKSCGQQNAPPSGDSVSVSRPASSTTSRAASKGIASGCGSFSMALGRIRWPRSSSVANRRTNGYRWQYRGPDQVLRGHPCSGGETASRRLPCRPVRTARAGDSSEGGPPRPWTPSPERPEGVSTGRAGRARDVPCRGVLIATETPRPAIGVLRQPRRGLLTVLGGE